VTVRFIEGFESGIFSPNITTTGTFALISSTSRSGTYCVQFSNTTGQQAQLRFGDFSADGVTATDMGITTQLYGQFYFMWQTLDNASSRICAFKTSGGTVGCEVKITTSATLELYTNATLRGTSTTVLTQGKWYRIAVLSTKGTSAAHELRINGSAEVVGTWSNGNVNIDRFFLTNDARGTASTDFYYDDVIGDDASFPLDGRVLVAVPNGAGASNEWTFGTGSSNFAECDEIPPDGGTTYVQCDATNPDGSERAVFAMEDFATIGGTGTQINAVQAVISVREVTAGTSSNIVRFTGADTTTAFNHGTSYATKGSVHTTNPGAGVAWSVTNFNSAQLGSTEQNAIAMRMDFCHMQVHFTPAIDTKPFFGLVG
jgi:hypothetical protein